MKYNPVIGLEIHAELKTNSKMFCSCRNDALERHPNINICPVCMGHPGTLPVANKEAIRKVIKTGLALNCQVPETSKFDRKNYFYPDLPKGYQISQYDQPLCKDGYLDVAGKKIKIRRVHLEEDTGKLLHPGGVDYSLVDFNRAGVPLMEMVTEPDLTSAKETVAFSQELQHILKYLGVSDADMEKGQMRIEVNISLQKGGAGELGTKVEIKNLNSFKAVEKAVEYEIQRQEKVLESGKKITHETRGWDDAKGETVSQREKEEAHDYRYFPEPDLPTLYLSKELVSQIGAEIPELPWQRRERFAREYGLESKSAEIFIVNKDLGEYFEKVVSEFKPSLSPEKLRSLIKLTTNYIITDLQGLLNGAYITDEDFLITPENFAEFIELIAEGKISSKMAKEILSIMFKTGADPSHIIEDRGLIQLSNEGELKKIIKDVLAKNQKAVEDYKKGKMNSFQFLIGQVMAQTKGKASPEIAGRLLKELLG